MVRRIKLFQTVLNSYQAIGLDSIQSNPKPEKYNQRFLFIVFSMMQMLVSTFAFFIFRAKTVQEFASSFYTSLTELFLMVVLFAHIPRMGDILKLNESYERFIEKSKWKYFELKKD